MSPLLVIAVISAYFLLLITISRITGKNADSDAFFTGNRQSPWYMVSFGMVGASLSGVTFVSMPGWVAATQFSYMQLVFGLFVGYGIITMVLLPLYYRLNLVSIYEYLEQRFGFWSYKTGAFYFLLSRIVGASFRLFLVAGVLQLAIFDAWGIDFSVTVLVTIVLIWLYTFKAGIKTIVWTDTLQTLFMLAAVATVVYLISTDLQLGPAELFTAVKESRYSKMFFWGGDTPLNFFKQFFAGVFIAVVMTGLDQDMMQKNLTCKSLGESQKNVFWLSVTLIIVNFLFLVLGALLYLYSDQKGIILPSRTDDVFPTLALHYFNPLAGIVFLLGIIAAAYSSADSALTALTTSFCVDFLNFTKPKNQAENPQKQKKIRLWVHIGFSLVLYAVILLFKSFNNSAIISAVYTAAGYTYGPLLGLFAFGMLSRLSVRDRFVPIVCFLSPVMSYLINIYSEELFHGYQFGFEILIVNGVLTFAGLLCISRKGIESACSALSRG